MDSCALFLDIDGVLHPLVVEFRNGQLSQEHLFNHDSMAQLKRIVEATGAELILSSSWRQFEDAKAKLQMVLKEWDVRPFTRSTPVLSAGTRADEILAFLDAQGRGVERWVVLDDEDVTGGKEGMMMDLIRSRFVRTESSIGMTSCDADKAIDILLSLAEDD